MREAQPWIDTKMDAKGIIMQRRLFLAGADALPAMGLPSFVRAQQATLIPFDGAWRAVGFPRLAPTG